MIGFLLFILLIAAAGFVSPWFLVAAFALLAINAFARGGRGY